MDKNKEKLIICCIVLFIMVLFVLIMLVNYLKKQTADFYDDVYLQDSGSSIIEEYGKAEENGINRNTYFDINNCITNYLGVINLNNSLYYGYNENGEYALIVNEKDINQKIYNLLSEKYISKNNITIGNLRNHIKLMEKDTLLVPLEITTIQNKEVTSFLVHGLVEDMVNLSVIDEIFVIVNIDIINGVFSIEPIYGEYKSIGEIKIEQLEDTIKPNDDNIFYASSVSYEDAAKNYLNLYKRIALGKPEVMYNLLNEEYREAKFKNVEEFKQYIEDNKQKILGIRTEKFQPKLTEEYSQFICIDQYGDYYIFIENAIMDYSVMLDTYTVDLPSFTEKYSKATEQEKVGMNIEKVITAINNKDYAYIYNKLDSTFRNNKFSTENGLQNYINNNFFESNNIEYLDFSQEGNVYIYKTKITDKNTSNSEGKILNIIMELGSGTEFTMSFNIE